MPEQRPIIMLSSSIRNFEETLDQVYAILTGYGYEVWMSHKGTIPLSSVKSNFDNCLDAVEKCDVFLGIITGRYGSGKEGSQPSITHQEMRRAIEINKIRYFLVDFKVAIAREILKQFRLDDKGDPRPHTYFQRNGIIDDIRVVDMYDEATLSALPLSERKGNWAQEYSRREDLMEFLRSQFENVDRIKNLLQEARDSTPSTSNR